MLYKKLIELFVGRTLKIAFSNLLKYISLIMGMLSDF